MQISGKNFLGKISNDCYGRHQHVLTLKLGKQSWETWKI